MKTTFFCKSENGHSLKKMLTHHNRVPAQPGLVVPQKVVGCPGDKVGPACLEVDKVVGDPGGGGGAVGTPGLRNF